MATWTRHHSIVPRLETAGCCVCVRILAMAPAWAQRGTTLSGGQLRFHRRGGVVQLASPARLDISARALGLTCYELASFDALIGRASPGEH